MILTINTSTSQFALGIISEDGVLISEYILPAIRLRSSFLMPSLDFVMRHSGIDKKELACIAVAIGPGSFTGLKVGLSVAKGICFSLDIPVIGISSLEALAIQLLGSEIPITAIMDSRKREYFVAQFVWHEDRLIQNAPDEYLSLEEFPERFKDKTIFIGNDYENQSCALREVMGKDVLMASSHLWHIRASSIGMLAVDRLKRDDFDDPLLLEPIYLRAPAIRPNPYHRLAN